MNSVMKLRIEEIFTIAIMSSTPAVIVEGKNDLKTYTDIAQSAIDAVDVYPVELIEGYSPGCGDVVKAIRALYALNDSLHPVENFVLGVIDRDTREYRGELPSEDAILALRYYSLESHFVNCEVLAAFLKQFTRTHESKFGPDFSRKIFEEIRADLLDIYYFSLEALKRALEPNYVEDFRYSDSIACRKQQTIRAKIMAKKDDLDQFALGLGIGANFDSLLKIANGKWLLTVFCELTEATFKKLKSYCGQFGAEQCTYCRHQDSNQCTYQVYEGINHKALYSQAPESWRTSALDYVRRRISEISLETVA